MIMPLIQIDDVYHVGSLEQNKKANQAKGSLEAFCLSVSLHPKDWTSIARIGGNPVWQMSRIGSLWLDVLSLDASTRKEITAWAVDNGFAEPATHWRSWSRDEDGEWRYVRSSCLEDAEYELDDPAEDGPCDDGSCIDTEEGYSITDLGMHELERWQEPEDYWDGIVILYAREIIAPKEPRLAGLWWDEDYDPSNLSCPRGAILPSRLSQFENVSLEKTQPVTFDP